jgi:serine/threonine protein kinase
MICPRCGNEWDANKSPCTRCGLVIRLPGQSGPLGRSASPSMQKNISQQPGSSLRPQSGVPSGELPPFQPQSQPLTSSRGSAGMQNTAQPFSSPQGSLPRSANISSLSATEIPRPSASQRSMPGFEQTMQNWAAPQAPTNFGSTQVGGPRTDALASKGVPPRPQSTSQSGRSANTFASDIHRMQNAPRPSRLVTDPLTMEPQRQHNNPSYAGNRTSSANSRSLLPGTILRGGRYRVHELHERQEWLSGVYEATWIAQDAQKGASQVMICEVVFPENDAVIVQSTLRTATMALTSVGRHPHIPTLWDAFSDRGRNFFVFEPVQGESLLNRMRRTGRAMSEQDVIECCLQMTEVLELLAQQSPPLVHGLIRPEHILVGRAGSQYILTNFSIILAGGATQFVSGIDRTRLSPYVAPEFIRGVIDVRSDLYALMATAYHAVTGSLPTGISGSIPPAQRLNPNVSAQFDAILGKGLRPIASQRYQRPSELRQELLTMRSVRGSLVPGSGQGLEQPLSRLSESAQRGQKLESATAQHIPDSIVQAFQSIVNENDDEQRLLLPRPEELPPLVQRNDLLNAAFWLVPILVCLVLVIIFSRGFF